MSDQQISERVSVADREVEDARRWLLAGAPDELMPDVEAMARALLSTDETLGDYARSLASLQAELERVKAAIRAAEVRRDPRHRVSMLVNDWQAILAALEDTTDGR